MHAIPTWVDRVHDRENNEQAILDVSFSPDGTQLAAAAGNKVLIYNAQDGNLLHTLKGHKDTVHSVSYSKDGKRLAAGGADKHVIIWTSAYEAILKYSHNDSVQCVAYNSVSPVLASCAASDFGIWSPEQKNVQKFRISSRICSCAWNQEGIILALGLSNGIITLRTKNGEEQGRIDRSSTNVTPIWAMTWINTRENEEILCVTDWGTKNLSFYSATGKQVLREKSLGYNVCRMSTFQVSGAEYLILGGSNKQCHLLSSEGVELGLLTSCDKWVWAIGHRPNSTTVAIGSEDGSIGCYQLIFGTVHGLFKEKYAFREHLTDVVVHHLLSDEKVRIQCRDPVMKISIYKNRLAVQLKDRFLLYELQEDRFHYVLKDRIQQTFDCNLMVLCTNHIILCQEKKLQSYNFQGVKEREWTLDSSIRYIKILGGLPNKEGLLLGTKNGQILKIFLDNPFPVELLKISTAVRCLDLNFSRQKLAIVDENNTCLVFSLRTKELIYQEPNANSVAWNMNCDDLLCFSGVNWLSIKASVFPCHQQKFQGFVVGFYGSKIFCLQGYNMSTLEVPLSAPMYQYLEKKMFREAYDIACMGVTEADWTQLAHEAVNALELDIATQAFQRIRDLKYLELMEWIETQKQSGVSDSTVFVADILAWQGKFQEAARLYRKCGRSDKAFAMFTDLRMFEQAKEYVTENDGADRTALLKKRADWASNVNEPRTAAEMYISAGEFSKAIEIASSNGWIPMLVDIARKLDAEDQDQLQIIAINLEKLGAINQSCDVLRKLGDNEALVRLLVRSANWDEALHMASKNPAFRSLVYLPYARWLAEQERFIETQKAFYEAGCTEEAESVMNSLALNAISQNKYDDAAYYFWLLGNHYLEMAKSSESKATESIYVSKFYETDRKSCAYYAYHPIHRFVNEPFTSLLPEALFNMARFLLHEIQQGPSLVGINQYAVTYSLLKQAKTLGACKLAKHLISLLQSLKIPPQFQDTLDLITMEVRSMPFQDPEELLPLCYRCSTTNPLFNTRGNCCVSCGEKFIFSFIAFEVLPLVEFYVDPGISDEEAELLIKTEPTEKANDNRKPGNVAFMEINDEESAADPFSNYLVAKGTSSMIVVDRKALEQLKPTDVIVCSYPRPLGNRYFRNFLPEIPLKRCRYCNKIFHSDDYELQYLQKERCPFCRTGN